MKLSTRFARLANSTALACSIIAIGAAAMAQPFQVGDVVEVDDAGIGSWERAVVMPLQPEDIKGGDYYRVKREKYSSIRDPKGEISQTIHMRSASGPFVEVGNPNAPRATSSGAAGSSISPVYSSGYRPGAATAASTAASTSASSSHTSSTPASAATTSTAAPAAASPSTGGKLNPQMAGGLPLIPGTGWDLMGMQKKGEPPATPKSFAQSFSFCKSGRWSITRYGLAAGQMGTYTMQGGKLLMINSLNNEPFGNFSMTWRAGDQMLTLDDGKWVYSLKLVSLRACGEQ